MGTKGVQEPGEVHVGYRGVQEAYNRGTGRVPRGTGWVQ